jgi:spore coat protein U-like protein
MGPGTFASLRPNTGGARWLRAVACAVLAAIALVPSSAFAQSANKMDVAQVGAAILAEGSIVKTADLNFGTIAPPGGAGTVVLTSQSTATCTTTGPLIRFGTCRAAAFSILYKNNKHVFIGDSSNGLITLTGPGGATMQVTNLNMSVAGLTGHQSQGNWDFGKWQVSDPNGFAQIYIGGTLHVGASQTPGTYTGTLTINVLMN